MTNSGLFCAVCNDPQNNPQPETVVMCTCGWKDRIIERETERERDLQTAVKMGFSAIGVLLVALHFVKWGGEAFSIPFYRLGQVTGTLSSDGYLGLSQACISAGQWDCAENAYLQSIAPAVLASDCSSVCSNRRILSSSLEVSMIERLFNSDDEVHYQVI